MAYYRVLKDCRVYQTVYRAGDVLDLGDPAYAGQLNAALRGALVYLGETKPAAEEAPPAVSASPVEETKPAAVKPVAGKPRGRAR
jgi:hypothetical protein